MSKTAPSPFQVRYTPNVPELLLQLQCTLILSTYQAGKLICLSPKDANHLIQLPRNFEKPMGIALSEDQNTMALATKYAITLFRDSPELALHYPRKPSTYDAMYMPTVSYHTNALDIHDLELVGDEIYGVNTLFSCIMKASTKHTFEPVWQPPFIDQIVSEDRCHLNGMAMENGEVLYATTFNEGTTMRSWVQDLPHTGTLISVPDNEVLSRDLAMPHSPILVDGNLYLLESALGTLVRVDRATGAHEVVNKVGGFVRGLAYYAGYFFIGHSRLRENSSTFGKLSIDQGDDLAGIKIVHAQTGALVGQITYESSVDEIYDVEILPKRIRPNILSVEKEESKLGVTIPGSTFWARPENNMTNLQQKI